MMIVKNSRKRLYQVNESALLQKLISGLYSNKSFLVQSPLSHTCWYNEQETFGKHRNVSVKRQIKYLNVP